MTRQLIKPIVFGILAGAAVFFMPFFFVRAIFFFLLIGALFRLFRGRRFGRWGYGYGLHPAFADTIRGMSDEEYQVFRQKFAQPTHCRKDDRKTDNKQSTL